MANGNQDREIFIKKKSGVTLLMPLIAGIFVIMVLALIGINSGSPALSWGIFIVAVAIVWWVRTDIWFAVDTSSVVVRAPFWRREIPFGDIAEVEVHPDDGTNSGAINWPVTTNKKENLTRLNLGGEAKVVLRIVDGARGTGPVDWKVAASELRDLEFVTSKKETAEEIAHLVRTKREAYVQAR